MRSASGADTRTQGQTGTFGEWAEAAAGKRGMDFGLTPSTQ